MADITLGQFYNAIAQGAREATLDALKNTDFATQTTLAEILSKLSDPATQATLLDVLNKLDDLTAVKNLLTEGDAKVQLKGQVEYKTLKRYWDYQQFNNDDVVTLISDLDMAGVIEWWVVHRQNFAVSIGGGVQYEAIFYHRPGEAPEDRTLTYYQDLITDNVGNQQGFTNPVRSFGRYMTLRVRNRTGANGYIRHIELVLVR